MSVLATTEQPTSSSLLKRILKRHPLISYFVIAFAGTWIMLLPIVLSKNGIGLLPISLPFVAFAVLWVGSTFLGPTLGAFVMTSATDGKAGVRQLLRRYIQWRVHPGWYLVAIFGFPFVTLLAIAIVPPLVVLNGLVKGWR